MAVTMDVVTAGQVTGVARAGADRWFFVCMAGLLVVVTLLGFIPSSLQKIAEVQSGQRPPFPVVLHVHAVLMGSWLVLLLAQASLVAADRRDVHRKLGLLSIALVPAIVIAGIVLTQTIFEGRWILATSGKLAPAAALQLEGQAIGVLLNQFRMMIVFSILTGLAVWVRRADPELHKRLMILAAIVIVQAGTERLVRRLGLPSTLPQSPLSVDLYALVLLVPMLAYDLIRFRRVHRAYAIGFAVELLPTTAMYLLHGSPWWFAVAPRLMGVDG